ncbi:membrane protein [Clostridia bacterium]|nr:membrane protein [Clostridia bacterium]
MNELNLFCFLVNLSIVLLCGVFIAIIPILTRQSYLFGVQVSPEVQEESVVKSMKKRYYIFVAMGTFLLLTVVTAQFFLVPKVTLLATLYVPFLFIIVQLMAFLPNRRAALQLKEERNWQLPDTEEAFSGNNPTYTQGNLSELPFSYYIVGLALVVVGVVIALFQYPSLSDAIPTHFNFQMEPDAWSAKSVLNVLMMPLINLGTLFILWLTGVSIVKVKLQTDPHNFPLSFAQHRMYRRRLGHGMGALALGIVVMFLLMEFNMFWPKLHIPLALVLAVCLIPAIVLVVLSLSAGQGGKNLHPVKNFGYKDTGIEHVFTSIAPKGRNEDKYWFLGMFYHNSADCAILVEDRFGNNIGLNYGRRCVKIGVVIGVVVFVLLYVWLTWLVWLMMF